MCIHRHLFIYRNIVMLLFEITENYSGQVTFTVTIIHTEILCIDKISRNFYAAMKCDIKIIF